jgi:hypothetical protein
MAQTALADLALEIRAKNAGPFWITMEAFMADDAGYRVAEQLITPETVAALYHVDARDLQIYRLPELRVVKVSFPRPLPQGSLRDRDMHAGQHHVPLAALRVPEGAEH